MLRAAIVAIVLLVQQQWVHIGSRQITSGGERDIIRTTSAGRLKRIRLVVEGGDLELFDVRITFADGTTFSPSGRFSFTGNSRSRVIALPGAARVVRWINFFYRRTTSGTGTATPSTPTVAGDRLRAYFRTSSRSARSLAPGV